MRNYELVVIAQPDLDEASMTSLVEKIRGWIVEAGGTVANVDMWGKRRMAYIINKRRDGQYVYFEMQMQPSFSAELERNLRFLEPVMRFMIVNRD